MRCPYRDFNACIIQECPSCNYKEVKHNVIEGRIPGRMSAQEAVEKGYAWDVTRTKYEFVSCKLVESNVQPVPAKKEVINNTTNNQMGVLIHRSIF